MRRNYLPGMLAILLLSLSACGAADQDPPASETIVINDPGAEEIMQPEGGSEGQDASVSLENGDAAGREKSEQPGNGSGTETGTSEQPGGGTGEGTGTSEQPEGENGSGLQPAQEDQAYQGIYYQAVADSFGDYRAYALIYLDADEVPELVILNREFDFYSIYTVKDGTLFCMMDSVAAVEMGYYERTGMLYEFWRFNGGGDEGDYGRFFYQVSAEETITEETPCLMQDEYHALYTQEGAFSGNGDYLYFYQKEAVDEGTYRELLSGFGVTEEGGRSLTENAVGKEEMLALLSE